MVKKQITENVILNTIKVNFMMNLLLKLSDNIIKFFISIIGPKTIKLIILPIENWFRKLLAIKASDDEHNEKRNAISIIIKMDITLSPLSFTSKSLEIIT